VSEFSIIDDLSNRELLGVLIEWGHSQRSVSVNRLQRLVNGMATAPDVAQYGEYWLRSLIDLAERAGVGQLERQRDGRMMLVFARELPDADDAWNAARGVSE
jgi:hypothetical protein